MERSKQAWTTKHNPARHRVREIKHINKTSIVSMSSKADRGRKEKVNLLPKEFLILLKILLKIYRSWDRWKWAIGFFSPGLICRPCRGTPSSPAHTPGAGSTYWSEYHMQWHGDVQIQGVVVHHADSEEHGYHDGIVPAITGNVTQLTFTRNSDIGGDTHIPFTRHLTYLIT